MWHLFTWEDPAHSTRNYSLNRWYEYSFTKNLCLVGDEEFKQTFFFFTNFWWTPSLYQKLRKNNKTFIFANMISVDNNLVLWFSFFMTYEKTRCIDKNIRILSFDLKRYQILLSFIKIPIFFNSEKYEKLFCWRTLKYYCY